ncbi:MAG: BtpA/SgcQ family protein [Phycisphaeraceae bacterium]|nr:BtpA/SgcQ family protein [Phycisphaeraceae bacterium]
MHDIFNAAKPVIGMVHVQALPGSPGSGLSIDRLAANAADEASLLAAAGFDGLIIENMHDRPYVHADHGPEIVAAMTAVGLRVREAWARGTSRRAPSGRRGLPIGVQVLSGGHREALAIALAIGGSFIRAENFVFAHVADEGLHERAVAGPLLRYRRTIGADDVRIFCDIKKKHASHAITGDVSIGETAKAAEFFGADGVIVTGASTGEPTALEDVAEARQGSSIPVIVGSGVTPETVAPLLDYADALIVGSSIKRGGLWSNPIDPGRAAAVVAAVKACRPRRPTPARAGRR